MSAALDERYFNWLYRQVCSVRTRLKSRSYRELFHILYTKEFVWLVPNDDNRVHDGKDLRYEFLNEEGIEPDERDEYWLNLPCSMLELLLSLARELEFVDDEGTTVEWFWELLENIGIEDLSDAKKIDHELVDDILDRVIWRRYNYNGGGGLFPLVYPEKDQRTVELWYQLNAYVIERL